MIGLVFGLCSHVFSQTLTIETSANGGSTSSWTVNLMDNNGVWIENPSTNPASYTANGATIQLTSLALTDPSISYGFTISSTAATSDFTFSFSLPGTIAPGPTDVSATLNGGVIAGTLSPLSLSLPIQQGLVGATDAGVDLGTSSFTGSINLSSGIQSGPSGGALGISVNTNFALSAGGSATLAGTFVVNPVVTTESIPEPSTYALLGIGLAMLALVARRRRLPNA